MVILQKLAHGIPQHILTYGTSLTAGGNWVWQMGEWLKSTCSSPLTITNSGLAASCSKWGLENIESRVLAYRPDVVFIEFSINDAYLPYEISQKQSKENLKNMIERIIKSLPDCQIILMTMNPPIEEHLKARPEFQAYSQIYHDMSGKEKLVLIDTLPKWMAVLNQDMTLFRKYVPDGIHPVAQGNANITIPCIKTVLNQCQGLGLHFHEFI